MYTNKYIDILEGMVKECDFSDGVDALNLAIASIKKEYLDEQHLEVPTKEELKEDMKTLSNRELATKYFVSLQTINNWKSVYGLIHIPFNKRVSDDEFIREYVSGTPAATLIKKWDVTRTTLTQRAKNLGVRRPDRRIKEVV